MANLEPIDITKSTSFTQPSNSVDFSSNPTAFNKLDDNSAKTLTLNLNDPLARKVHSLFGLSVNDSMDKIENTTGTSQQDVSMVAQQHMQTIYKLEQEYNIKIDQLTKQYGSYSNIPIDERAKLKQARVDILAFKNNFNGKYVQGDTSVTATNDMAYVQDLQKLSNNANILKQQFKDQPYRTVEYDKNTGKFVAKVHVPERQITGDLVNKILTDNNYHQYLKSKGIEPTEENALKFYTTYVREFGKSALDVGASAGKLLDNIALNGKFNNYFTTAQQNTQNLFGTTNADTQIADAYARDAAKNILSGKYSQGLGNLYESMKKGGLNYFAQSLPYVIAFALGGEYVKGVQGARFVAANAPILMSYVQNNLDSTEHNNGGKKLTAGQTANAAVAGILEYALDKIGFEAMFDKGVFKAAKGKLFVNLGDKKLSVDELIKVSPHLGTKLAQYIKNGTAVGIKAATLASGSEFINEAGQQVLETFSQKYNKPGSSLFDPSIKFSNDDKVNILTAGLIGYGLGAGTHATVSGVTSNLNLYGNLKTKDAVTKELMGAVKGMTKEEATQYMNNLQTELNKQYAESAPFSVNPSDGSFDVNAFNSIMNTNHRNELVNTLMNQKRQQYFDWLSKIQQLEYYKNLIAKAHKDYFYSPISEDQAKLNAEDFIKKNLNKAPGLGITSQLAINGLLGVGATVAATGGIATPMAVLTGFALGQKIPFFNFLYQTTKVSKFKNFISNLPTAKLQELKYILNDPRIMDTVDKSHKTLYDNWINSVNTELDTRNKSQDSLMNAFNMNSHTPEHIAEINTLYNRYQNNKDIKEGLDTLKDIDHTKHFSDSLVKLSNALKSINEIEDDRDKSTLIALVDDGVKNILEHTDPEHLKDINEETYNNLRDNLTSLTQMSNDNLGSSVSGSEEELADRIARQVMSSLQNMLQQNPVFRAILSSNNYGEFKKNMENVSNELIKKGYTDQYGIERTSLEEHINNVNTILDDIYSANTEQEKSNANANLRNALSGLYTLLRSRSTHNKFVEYNVRSADLAMSILNENKQIIDAVEKIKDRLSEEEQNKLTNYTNEMLTLEKLENITGEKVDEDNILRLVNDIADRLREQHRHNNNTTTSNKKSNGSKKKKSKNSSSNTQRDVVKINLSVRNGPKYNTLFEYVASKLNNVAYDKLVLHYRFNKKDKVTIFIKVQNNGKNVGIIRLYGLYNITNNRASITITNVGDFIPRNTYDNYISKLGGGRNNEETDPEAKTDKTIVNLFRNIINHDNVRTYVNKQLINNIKPEDVTNATVQNLEDLKRELNGAYAYSDILKLTRHDNKIILTLLFTSGSDNTTLNTAFREIEFKNEKDAIDLSNKIASLYNINNLFFKNTTMAYSNNQKIKDRLYGISLDNLSTISGLSVPKGSQSFTKDLFNSIKYTLTVTGKLNPSTNTDEDPDPDPEPGKKGGNNGNGNGPGKGEDPDKKEDPSNNTNSVNDEYDNLLKNSISDTGEALRERDTKTIESNEKLSILRGLFNKRINKFKKDVKKLNAEKIKFKGKRKIRKGTILHTHNAYIKEHNKLTNKLNITKKILSNIDDERILDIKDDINKIVNNYNLDNIPSDKIKEYTKNIDTIIKNIDEHLNDNGCKK